MNTMLGNLLNLIISFFVKLSGKDKKYLNLGQMLETVNPSNEPDESIIVDLSEIRNKWHQGWARPVDVVDEIVIHCTGGGVLDQTFLEWTLNYGREGYKTGVGPYHFLIGRNEGKIYNWIKKENFSHHCHAGTANHRRMIAIEIMNPSVSNADPVTDAQYESLMVLIFEILMFYFPITKISSHGWWYAKNVGGRYVCPGPGFDQTKLVEQFSKREIYFQDISGMGGFAFSNIKPRDRQNG